MLRCAVLAGTIGVSSLFLSAQTGTSQLTGILTDPAKALIAGAQVTLTNVGTGAARSTTSNSDGYYTLVLLEPGIYTLRVQKTGFETMVQTGLKLDVAQSARLDFTLSLGSVNQEISVSASGALLESETATLGQTIDNNAIVNLPLNGRNSYAFATLVPGVRAALLFTGVAYSFFTDQYVSINGSRPNQNLFLLDGGANSNAAFNGPGFYPSVDLVQEYKVQTNNYSAEYTETTGGVVNVVTKSGTNQVHGDLFEFLRNSKLEATNFFINQAGQTKGAFIFNEFGGTVGGPVVIPHLYNGRNRTFFFFSYDGLRWVQSYPMTTSLPTTAQRTGDFSNTKNQNGQLVTIYDPASTVPNPSVPGTFTRSPFAGNIIPVSRQDPVAVNIMNHVPPPNLTGAPFTAANNFTSNASAPLVKDAYSQRLDEAFNDSNRFFARVSIQQTDTGRPKLYGPEFLVATPINATNEYDNSRQATTGYTRIINPTTVMDLSSSFVRYTLLRITPAVGFNPVNLGQPAYMNQLQPALTPCFPVAAVSGLGVPLLASGVGGGFIGSCGVLNDGYDNFNEHGTFTRTAGNHTVKFGARFTVKRLNTNRYSVANSSYSFTPSFTQGPNPQAASATSGVAFASMLLGVGTGSITTNGPGVSLAEKSYGGFVQDDWKVTSRLTLNLGIRWDHIDPRNERYNRITDFNFTAPSPLKVSGFNLTGGLEFPGVNGLPRGDYSSSWRDVAPRFGFAYLVTPRTVVRGGVGVFYGPTGSASVNGNTEPIAGFQSSTAWVGSIDGLSPTNYLSNPYPNGFIRATGSSLGLGTLLGNSIVGLDRDHRDSQAYQWNVGIQQTLPGQFVVEAAYAGSRGLHLVGDLNYNALPDQNLALGSTLTAKVANPLFGLLPAGSALNTPTISAGQLLLPYPQFSAVTMGFSSYASSVYHAFELTARRRVSSNLSMLLSYTFSKSMDDDPNVTEGGFPGESISGTSFQDPNNRRGERALSPFDAPQSFTVSAVYNLPFGPGHALLANKGLLSGIFGNWRLNGINTFRSGVPLGLTTASNTLGTFEGTQRPNWNGAIQTVSGPISNRLNDYFNTAAFTTPAPFTYGNTGRLLSSLRGPGVVNLDLSLDKEFPVIERVRLQFRAEAFNSLNHPLFGLPGVVIGSSTAGVISQQLNLPRDIQFGLKLLF
ncbi:MAG TPA: carboxypeptidase regulatory-like domain-containing protein [Candidatus Acidoferrales bacterium]|nr:carboxypeptidase regulatory-like domain-containing protein [Candidatus Acidoferrales bacterium]